MGDRLQSRDRETETERDRILSGPYKTTSHKYHDNVPLTICFQSKPRNRVTPPCCQCPINEEANYENTFLSPKIKLMQANRRSCIKRRLSGSPSHRSVLYEIHSTSCHAITIVERSDIY